MRRFSSASYVSLAAILFFTVIWSACGGGSGHASYTVASFTFTPSPVSLVPGQVATVSATPYNSSGSVISTTVTYSLSDGTQLGKNLSISQGGLLCAGNWDATFTVCTPSQQVGQYTIVATANGATGNDTVYVHYPVTAVYLEPPAASCTSMGSSFNVAAHACTTQAYAGASCPACPDNPSLCDVTDSVGAFNFNVIDSTVASIDSTGKLTAGVPGTTKLYASVSSGNSVALTSTSTAVPYTTCPVDSIQLTVQNQTDTAFTVANGSSTTLAAVVKDTLGATIAPTLTFNNPQASVATVSGSTNTGTYTGKAPGYGGVVASCTPPGCNKNLSAVFSNVVTATVKDSSSASTVTANETNVYVSGAGSVQMFPVDTKDFTIGTGISLPYAPNSMAISRDGSHIYLGNATNAEVINTSSNSVQALTFGGKILAVAPNNAYVVYASPTSVYVMSGTSFTLSNANGFSIPNVTAATFTPDGNTVYFAAGANIYRYRIIGDSGSTPTPLALTPGGAPLSAAANDLQVSANGTVLFSSSGANVVADETCNASVASQFLTAFEPLGSQGFTAPAAMAVLPNGTGVLAVDGMQLDQVSITNPNPLSQPFAGCPAANFATTPSTISLSSLGSGFTVNQLLISNTGNYAAVLTGCPNGGCTPQVGIINLTNGAVTPVALVNQGTVPLKEVFSGDFMIDDSGIWVGADDTSVDSSSNATPLGTIHFIDVTKLQDTQQVNVQLQGASSGQTANYVYPTFVAVQRK